MLKLFLRPSQDVIFLSNVYSQTLRNFSGGFTKLAKAEKGNWSTVNDSENKPKEALNVGIYKIVDKKPLWEPSPCLEKGQLIDQYKKLSKFRLTTLVVITTMAGYAVAPAPFDPASFLMVTVGTGLVSAAANSVNQFHEVPFDSQMSRTKSRVLVTGKVTPLHAMGFALVSGAAGLSILYYGVNGLTAALGLSNFILYTSIYTPMKRISILNTWVGSAVGAIPPLIGWAGCCGSIDAGAWILAGLLYAWQFPHFNALSWNLRPDYSRAGYQMMAVTNPGLCRRTALRYTFVITLLSTLAPIMDVTNYWFALETLPLNAYFSYLAYKFYKDSNSGSSRKLFRFSLVHLPLIMILFLLNKKRWFFAENTEDTKKHDPVDTNVGSFIKLNLPHINASTLETSSKTV
ncbi:protoheme IX farnesyltransferase, mitochondrial [Musca vetustissima]|uniref:protoheme IX farnesyltransferase, mitochondrial n=1 Tax=Musca vetustissima TaxID=27455 RepID=UPI002AB618A5|nr:protoheme IX farnesyltransferase, mitochondrial [Musca vetustissima]